jgi:bifunctional DNA-binding transcriptional regulator/antitoxin component of YhaV-PrlF toxin-antitoxin module
MSAIKQIPSATVSVSAKVTAKGQVTFRKEVLQHLGVKPGQTLSVNLLPNGRGLIQALPSGGSIDDFIGTLSGRSAKVASLEEISLAAAQGWAGTNRRASTKKP